MSLESRRSVSTDARNSPMHGNKSGHGSSIPLPPAGPAWFPSVMGTGLLANLLHTHAPHLLGAHILSAAVLGIAWVLLIGLTFGFVFRVVRKPSVFSRSITDFSQMPFWATVSMGYLSVGSASTVVVPSFAPGLLGFVWGLNTGMWVFGTVVGVCSAFGFAARLIGVDRGAPTTIWGLAVVGPMVSSTTGANLVPHVSETLDPYVQVVSIACFFLSLFVGSIIFACSYNHQWRVEPIPVVASVSAWIPLGVVGQSTAAAQAMAFQTDHLVLPETQTAMHNLANLYGWIMLIVGIPLVIFAVAMTIRGFYLRMPFTPGWWAMTFPLGTLALGATLFARGTGLSFFTWLGAFGTVCLVGTVTLCLAMSTHAVIMQSRGGSAQESLRV
ncbi:C4-dicarboxylate ABC transporter [Corynebacterium ulcerans]|uniref:TDT family transporter n=1 Tax=Corynebacterium ulcerans TaxID=65058 RepID=UPI000C755EFB|nr:TDT family transporter [Corynebacterium ulcerans]PLV99475.1 C4-dicarboxylate ABC transporter [Corynebacterium ulcerans]